MVFVLAGLQTMLINPIAFVLLGVGAAKRDAAKQRDGSMPTSLAILAAVLRAKLKDPLVIATFAGLAFNGSFAGLGGAELPVPRLPTPPDLPLPPPPRPILPTGVSSHSNDGGPA